MRRLYLFCLALFFGLASSAHAAGLQLLDTDPTLAGAIWYPCAAEPQPVPLGKVSMNFITTLQGVKDCPVSGSRLPLAIIAHGRGGWFGGHDDTAQALADAGFVVAAINYPGDNGADRSQSDSLSIIAARPKETIRLLDFMLNEWRDRAVIDPEKIGFFGFSAGAYTGLILAGAKPDYQKIAGLCTEGNNSPGCEQFRRGDIPPEPQHDPRIRAAVLADTALNFMFSADGLTDVHIPLLIWRSKSGGGGIDPKNVVLTASSLPGKPEVRVMPAGHFGFLAPCTEKFAAELPRLCADPPGFDRTAFHHELNASIVSFLRDHLATERKP
ncbi:prolyl oligopeptidase family serine peptidase [Bradyrhizobium sp. CIAT3101]|uniref:alpha/beta hydrolase family protein n=1 Tax=Bradyrhizobium sp. CIAT3101 TaxID=439387 RepID=UPI0024B181E8|nr:prolyl oligopeptidase family serine peptidase [Bradyrhizobium sp. CIAT3101]WFU82166.1 prolyl oligopeptidase family serine peptidase [Bradyrhizobium sp. CIAT3101]